MPRSEEKAELKCRSCEEVFPAEQFTNSQKWKKHRRRCPACVALSLYLRGEGPKPADVTDAPLPEEYGRIQLATQLLPPQKLSGVAHLHTIVVEPSAAGPGQRRSRTEAGSYQNSQANHDDDVAERLFDESASPSKNQFKKAGKGAVITVVEDASSTNFKGSKGLKKAVKTQHKRQPSSSEQARELYLRQVKGRRKYRASRDFGNEEEQPELLKGEKGRKRLGPLEGGYPRESMKPGPERIIGGQ